MYCSSSRMPILHYTLHYYTPPSSSQHPARGARGPHGGFTKPFRVHCRNLLVDKALRSRAMPPWSPGNRMAPTVCVGSSMRNDICRPGPRFHSSTDAMLALAACATAGCADGPGPLHCTRSHSTRQTQTDDTLLTLSVRLSCLSMYTSPPSLSHAAIAAAASTPLRLCAGSETRFHPANSPRRYACLPTPSACPVPTHQSHSRPLAPSRLPLASLAACPLPAYSDSP
ncbi:hypothetical protein COCVIDRAFT_11799 [Bipolaris victoriae FI3]|uniref:Uncharacterized protein n=1 Tax=Bipolaris victoriae (strain FI3) TaxID=930091 RepID=W7EZ27_BIPV3|nr:hypothetical protein COCVIDRAFT_11799 [Bipolaris victoriae FI3]